MTGEYPDLAETSALAAEARAVATAATDTGEIYSLDPADVADLATAAVADVPPEAAAVFSSAIAADYAAESVGAFAASAAEATRGRFAELRARRRAGMYAWAGLSEEDAARVGFDEANGDLSPLNALRAMYFFE